MQNVPISNHYLHSDFIKDWPTPWELLSDNIYCYYARALGMFYSMRLLGNNTLEIVEAKDHPFFIGVQFHPELKSKPFEPHPLFVSFIESALRYKKKNA